MEQERCTAPPYLRLQPQQFCRYLCQLPLKATKCLTLWMLAQLSHVPRRELSRKAKWKHTNADHVSSTQKLYNRPPGSRAPHKKHWQHQPQSLSLTAQMKFFIGTIATVVITITLPRWLDTNMIFTFEHSSWAVCPIGKASGCWWGGDIVKLLEKDTFWKAIRLFLLYRKSSPNGKSSIIACSSWFNQMFCGFKLSDGMFLKDRWPSPVFNDMSHSVDSTALFHYRQVQPFSGVSTGFSYHPFIQSLGNQVLRCGNRIINKIHHRQSSTVNIYSVIQKD